MTFFCHDCGQEFEFKRIRWRKRKTFYNRAWHREAAPVCESCDALAPNQTQESAAGGFGFAAAVVVGDMGGEHLGQDHPAQVGRDFQVG